MKGPCERVREKSPTNVCWFEQGKNTQRGSFHPSSRVVARIVSPLSGFSLLCSLLRFNCSNVCLCRKPFIRSKLRADRSKVSTRLCLRLGLDHLPASISAHGIWSKGRNCHWAFSVNGSQLPNSPGPSGMTTGSPHLPRGIRTCSSGECEAPLWGRACANHVSNTSIDRILPWLLAIAISLHVIGTISSLLPGSEGRRCTCSGDNRPGVSRWSICNDSASCRRCLPFDPASDDSLFIAWYPNLGVKFTWRSPTT